MPPSLCGRQAVGAMQHTRCGNPVSLRGELVAERASNRKTLANNEQMLWASTNGKTPKRSGNGE